MDGPSSRSSRSRAGEVASRPSGSAKESWIADMTPLHGGYSVSPWKGRSGSKGKEAERRRLDPYCNSSVEGLHCLIPEGAFVGSLARTDARASSRAAPSLAGRDLL